MERLSYEEARTKIREHLKNKGWIDTTKASFRITDISYYNRVNITIEGNYYTHNKRFIKSFDVEQGDYEELIKKLRELEQESIDNEESNNKIRDRKKIILQGLQEDFKDFKISSYEDKIKILLDNKIEVMISKSDKGYNIEKVDSYSFKWGIDKQQVENILNKLKEVGL